MRYHSRSFLSLIVLFLFSISISAQNKISDSLNLLLRTAKHDTTRCVLLNLLIESENNDAVWPGYNEQLLKIAEINLKDPGNLKDFYFKSKAIAINNLGYLSSIYGDNIKAAKFYEEALSIQRQIGEKAGTAASLYNLGDIYANLGDISKALEYLHNSLDLHEELKDKMGTAYVLNDLGWQYHVQGDNVNGMLYLNKALAIRQKLNDSRGLANTYNNLGILCLEKKEYDKGMDYFKKTLQLTKADNDLRGVALALNSMGAIYQVKGELNTALEYYRESAAIQLRMNDKDGWVIANNNAADVVFLLAKQGKKTYNEALNMGRKSMEGALQVGFPGEVRTAAQTLNRIYVAMGDYKKGLEYYELFIKMRDSVSNVQTRKASVKKQFQYQYEKKAAADSVRNAEEQKIKDAQLNAQQSELSQERTQRYALYGGLVLIVIFLVFVFNRFRITRKQKAIIEKQKLRVDLAYEKLHEKNKEVMDSITYARRIQNALLPSEKYIERKLKDL